MKSEVEAKQLIINAFPGYDLENLGCHGDIERELANDVEKFTKEQWDVLLSREADYAFQDGMAHISWNTDRHIIFNAIKKKFKRLSSWSSDGSWYKTITVEYQAPNGLYFRLTEEVPHSFSGGSYHYHINIIDEKDVTPIFTHTAVILSVDVDGIAYIRKQMTGTLDYCEKFVEENLESGQFFKIMERK